MAELFSWVKNIAYLTIFITVIVHILPDRKYEKYLRLYMGVLLILFILSPAAKLFHIEDTLENIFLRENLRLELSDTAYELELKEASQYEKIREQYEKELDASVLEYLDEKGYECLQADVIWNMDTGSESFGNVEGLSVIVSKKEEGKERQDGKITVGKVIISAFHNEKDDTEENLLKNELGNFYNMPVNNINVSIRGGDDAR